MICSTDSALNNRIISSSALFSASHRQVLYFSSSRVYFSECHIVSPFQLPRTPVFFFTCLSVRYQESLMFTCWVCTSSSGPRNLRWRDRPEGRQLRTSHSKLPLYFDIRDMTGGHQSPEANSNPIPSTQNQTNKEKPKSKNRDLESPSNGQQSKKTLSFHHPISISVFLASSAASTFLLQPPRRRDSSDKT